MARPSARGSHTQCSGTAEEPLRLNQEEPREETRSYRPLHPQILPVTSTHTPNGRVILRQRTLRYTEPQALRTPPLTHAHSRPRSFSCLHNAFTPYHLPHATPTHPRWTRTHVLTGYLLDGASLSRDREASGQAAERWTATWHCHLRVP